jgi:hypothetical protein
MVDNGTGQQPGHGHFALAGIVAIVRIVTSAITDNTPLMITANSVLWMTPYNAMRPRLVFISETASPWRLLLSKIASVHGWFNVVLFVVIAPLTLSCSQE